MELAVSAASWAVGKALAPVTGGLLEAWAASEGLGPNVDALKEELLYAQAILENTRGREIRSPSLKELLRKLRQLAYDADDVLDELDYFRIQDELDGTYDAADEHAGGCVHGLALNARHTARAVAAKLNLSSSGVSGDDVIPADGDPDQQDNNAKQGCFAASVCSCGGQTVSSVPQSPTNQEPAVPAPACAVRNGRQFLGAVLPSKVQRYFSGAACFYCGKREVSSSPPAPSNQCEKKVGGGCGCLPKVTSTARSAAQVVGKCFPCCSFSSDDNHNTGMSEKTNMPEDQRRFLCWNSKVQLVKNTALPPELKFNRVDISTKIKDIIEHLKPICAKVSNILNLEFMGTNRITEEDIAKKRPITTSEITEPKLYGREQQKEIILNIVHGKSSADNDLVVLLVVGPGGIGKTTFTQHVYEEVKSNPFKVAIWICVSLNFKAGKLAEEAVKKIPEVDNENKNSSVEELIEQRLKGKRFLLVLDDMWACQEDEWKKLLAPFRRGGEKGSMVIVTTRIREVAKKIGCYEIIEMESLKGDNFMRFFEDCIFDGQNSWEDPTNPLREVGKNIVSKLKGSPLAAKTVGRLLRNQPTLEHWTKVLESKEWELLTDNDDIMPVLRLSYDYLPFDLQQCFYYCGLFPEDYEFDSKELIHFWIGLGIVQPCALNQTIEETGQRNLNDLVNHGFLKKIERKDACPYYVVHDLLHNLAVNISSFECLSICSSNIKSVQISQDVRHLSIIIDNKDVEDINTFKYYKYDLSVLGKRLNAGNLRTLMVFGEHSGSFAKTFCDLFEKARALRAIYLFGPSLYAMKVMLNKLPKHIHLRYLRIKSTDDTEDRDFDLSALPRLYHLEVIDMQEFKGHCGSFNFTRHMSNLVKLRHFLVPQDKLQLHSNIVDVGKLKLLQELRRFEVGRENKGFELRQLGQLSELGGSLSISSLERIREMEDVHEARLIQIKHLRMLTLEWDANRPKEDTIDEENVLNSLIPPSDLKGLCIRGHGSTKCPQWLGEDLSVKKLEYLRLDGVAWNISPSIGDLLLDNGPHEEISSNIHQKRFQNLRRLELVNLPGLKSCDVKAPCHLFAHLKLLIILNCSELTTISFSHSTCCQREREEEAHMNRFPGGLQRLEIAGCPKLLSFPPVPWTNTLFSMKVRLGSKILACQGNQHSGYILWITEGEADALHDGTFWNVLAFHNLTALKGLLMTKCPPLPLHHFQMLSSLRTLWLNGGSSIIFPSACHSKYQSPVEHIEISGWNASAKELTQLLTYFPKLSELDVSSCRKIKGLAVVEKEATETPPPASSSNKVDDAVEIEQHQKQDDTRREEEIAATSAEGLLLLPSQLQKLGISGCPKLSLQSIPVDHNSGGQWLQGLCALLSLGIVNCPRFLSSYSSSSSSSCFPFPTSLERLSLRGAVGTATRLPLSNLASLTDLYIKGCGDLRVEGLLHLLAQGRLTQLSVFGTPSFFAGPEPPLPHEQEFPSSSCKLRLVTDDVAGVLAPPICAVLSSSLTALTFWMDEEVERFTKEQEEALQLLHSLEEITFLCCDKLQCLPAGLHGLPNLKRLDIIRCAAIRSFPKDGLPSSLQKLYIDNSRAIQSIPKNCLPNSLQKLLIRGCPAIRSLPKVNDLPSSLQELNVKYSESKELSRQCRKLIGIIPVVYV